MDSTFNKKLKTYLTVYKVPIAPDSLDPTVFYFPETGEHPKLLPSIQAQITNDLMSLAGDQPYKIVKCVLVGDVVTPGNKNKNSDIKVLVQLNKELISADSDGLLAEEILKLCNALSKRIAVGTTRKLRYVPTLRSIDTKDYNGIYDINASSWLKIPSGLKS